MVKSKIRFVDISYGYQLKQRYLLEIWVKVERNRLYLKRGLKNR